MTGLTSIRVQSMYKGVKIKGGHASVIFDGHGKMASVNNYFKPIHLANATPSFTVTEAEEIIQQTFAPKIVEPGDGKMELVVYPSLPPRLAYHAYRKIAGWNWIIYIDAVNGEVLSSSRIGSEPQPISIGKGLDSGKTPQNTTPSPVYPLPLSDSTGINQEKRPDSSAGNRAAIQFWRVKPDDEKYPPKNIHGLIVGTSVLSCCSFWEDYIEFELQYDGDGDGYYRQGYVQWDADTDDDSAGAAPSGCD